MKVYFAGLFFMHGLILYRGHLGEHSLGGKGPYHGLTEHYDLPVTVVEPPPSVHGQNPNQIHHGYREDGRFHHTAQIPLQHPETTSSGGHHDGAVFSVPIHTELRYPGDYHYRRCKGGKCKVEPKVTFPNRGSLFNLIHSRNNNKPDHSPFAKLQDNNGRSSKIIPKDDPSTIKTTTESHSFTYC